MMPIPAHVAQFRKEYRRDHIARYYSGELHLAFTSAVLLGGIAWHLRLLSAPSWLELLMIPATIVFGNCVEYLVHRYPLHQVYPLFKPLYHIHSLQHHRFYIYESMEFESFRDFMMVLFPPWAPVLVVAFTSAVGSWLVAPVLSLNAGHLFSAAGTACLLLYEVLHSLSHCDDESWAGKLPFIQGIRLHHRLHHHPVLMSRWNFNITFPFFDLLLGTATTAAPTAPRPAGRQLESV